MAYASRGCGLRHAPLRQPAEPEDECHQTQEDDHAQADHVGGVPQRGSRRKSLVSRMTSHTCQCCRMPLRAKPMSPMSQVKVTASTKSAYCDRSGILPHGSRHVTRTPQHEDVDDGHADDARQHGHTW